MASKSGRIKSVFPGNKFEYWLKVTSATDVYPSNGAGGPHASEGAAIWDNGLGLPDGSFVARITRVRWDQTDSAGSLTCTITARTGGDEIILTQPGFANGILASDQDLNIAMEDGFSALLSAATGTVYIFFEVVQYYTADNVKL